MKALVTGGGGFLGGSIVRLLVERGDGVISFSRGRYPELEKLGVIHESGDLVNPGDIRRAVRNCDTVFHVAAKAGSWGFYEDFYCANVTGTENVIDACREAGVRRLVYTSSPSVVFNNSDMEGVNESVPYAIHDRVAAGYPATKAIAEKIVLAANDDTLATVALRPHLIFGPGDNHLVPQIVDRAKKGRLKMVGSGKNKIDIIYVDNAAKAHILAADRLEPRSKIAGKAYFISNDDPRSIEELFNRIMDIYGLPKVKQKVPVALAYFGGWMFEKVFALLRLRGEPWVTRFIAKELSTSHWFDISAARRDFGYHPEISIEEGFNRMRESFG